MFLHFRLFLLFSFIFLVGGRLPLYQDFKYMLKILIIYTEKKYNYTSHISWFIFWCVYIGKCKYTLHTMVYFFGVYTKKCKYTYILLIHKTIYCICLVHALIKYSLVYLYKIQMSNILCCINIPCPSKLFVDSYFHLWGEQLFKILEKLSFTCVGFEKNTVLESS